MDKQPFDRRGPCNVLGTNGPGMTWTEIAEEHQKTEHHCPRNIRSGKRITSLHVQRTAEHHQVKFNKGLDRQQDSPSAAMDAFESTATMVRTSG